MKKLVAILLALVLCVSACAYAEETWTCPHCGTENSNPFCGQCGAKKPESLTGWYLEAERDKFGDETGRQVIVCAVSGTDSRGEAYTGTVSFNVEQWTIALRDKENKPIVLAPQVAGQCMLSLKSGDTVEEESEQDNVSYREKITFKTDEGDLAEMLAWELAVGQSVTVLLSGEVSASYTFKLTGEGFAQKWSERAAALFEKQEYEQAELEFAALAKCGFAGASEQVQACEDAIHNRDYQAAKALLDEGRYDEAKAAFAALGNYSDSADMVKECDYQAAKALFEAGRYDKAKAAFAALGSYRDSADMVGHCEDTIHGPDYAKAKALFEAGGYEEAKAAFAALGSYSDSADMVSRCEEAIKERDYQAAKALFEAGGYEEAKAAFAALGSYSDSADMVSRCETAIKERNYQAAKALLDKGRYNEAKASFAALGSYSDSADMVKECDYQAAKALYAKGDYVGALKIFNSIRGYKDVDSLLANDQNLSAAVAAAREPYTQVGTIVTYGHYEQDNNAGNGKEAIEWIVLAYDSASGRSLLLSRYGLDAHRFDKSEYRGWAESEMRSWLNGTFLNNAFTAKEQAGIVTSRISTPAFKGYSGGADTEDKLWLLSRDEASTYFNSKEAGKATPTKYAVARGAFQNSTGCCRWWLRSPYNYSYYAFFVDGDGSLYYDLVDCTDGAVRPAFWLDLASADIC